MSGNYIVAAAVILMAALALVINYSALAAASEAEEMEIYSRIRREGKMDRSKFRMRLLEQLDKHNMTQHRLATELNVSDAAVSNWLAGRQMPRLESIGKISLIFDVSVGYLLGED